MDALFAIERQQTLHYVKARLALLGEQKIQLELHERNGQLSYQIKVIDYKIDRLLELLHELQETRSQSADRSAPRLLTTF